MICPIHHALLKHNLVMGGDRECMMMTFLIGAVIFYADTSLVGFAIGAFAVLVLTFLFRSMAERDVYLVPILRRNWNRGGWIAAKSCVEGRTWA